MNAPDRWKATVLSRSLAGSTALPLGQPLLAALAGLALMLALLACTGDAAGEGRRAVLTVAAASDLQNAFGEVGSLFEAETGAKVVFQFGASGTLAQQIAQGAPVDLFAAASEEYVQDLVAKGVAIPDTQVVYALGRLALVTPRNSAGRVERLTDLLKPEVRHLAIANPEHAPYGRAAREALRGAGLWEQLAGKVVYGENVRQALQFVQTGNADAGIVALSIAGAPEVETIPLDDTLYTPLRQSLVVVRGTSREDLARAFAALLLSEKGQAIMQRHGFMSPHGGRR